MNMQSKDKPQGLRQRQFTRCVCCNNGMAHNRQMMFFVLTLEHHGLDFPAIQRQHGLEQMLGAAAGLAVHMGPDEPLSVCLNESTIRALVCQGCALEHPLHHIYKCAVKTAEAEAEAEREAEASAT